MSHEEGSELDRDLVEGVPDDQTIGVEAKDALHWNGVDVSRIRVGVCGGTVVLSGVVPSEEQRERAEAIVAGIRGVTEVSNDLTVGAPQGR